MTAPLPESRTMRGTPPVAAQRFALDAIAPTPWKNGGGVTREIAAWPRGAGLQDFDWRVSVADIAAAGPFSAFAGIDRQIVLLDGAGVRLRADDGRFDHRLDRVGVPFAFAGETAVQASLLGGVTRDFNVMTRRGRCVANVVAERTGFAVAPGRHTVLLLALAGTWTSASFDLPLQPGEGLLCEAADGFAVQPAETEAALCLYVTLETKASR